MNNNAVIQALDHAVAWRFICWQEFVLLHVQRKSDMRCRHDSIGKTAPCSGQATMDMTAKQVNRTVFMALQNFVQCLIADVQPHFIQRRNTHHRWRMMHKQQDGTVALAQYFIQPLQTYAVQLPVMLAIISYGIQINQLMTVDHLTALHIPKLMGHVWKYLEKCRPVIMIAYQKFGGHRHVLQ